MKKILYLIRAEADFERMVCLGTAGKDHFDQSFYYVGDTSLYYNTGLKNSFIKHLAETADIKIYDFSQLFFGGRIFKYVFFSVNGYSRLSKFITKLVLSLAYRYQNIVASGLIRKLFSRTLPDILITDQSMEDENYLPERIRKYAVKKGVKVYLVPHGPAGGLHHSFAKYKYGKYENYTVLVSNQLEAGSFHNRIVTGDPCCSFPYVNYLNKINFGKISFHDDRKYRISFLIGGTIQSWSSTNSWKVQEEIIIDLSERDDVAMVLKLHPREAKYLDLRMLRTFTNLVIVEAEIDRSRVTQWANIIVCNDHTSVVFEPMILGKKVVAIEGRHIPRYKNVHSPQKGFDNKLITIKKATIKITN